MSILGIQLILAIGPELPLLAPPPLTEALESVEVSHSDEGPSGFQLSFRAGRGGPLALRDEPLLMLGLLRPFYRVQIMVRLGARLHVLMDGPITNIQFDPGSRPGAGTLSVTGEDMSVMMDREEQPRRHPGTDLVSRVQSLLAPYQRYGVQPLIPVAGPIKPNVPVENTPLQHATDLQYIRELADEQGFIFFVKPGPVPGLSTAYWGPRSRAGAPQRALTANMGPLTNVDSISFQLDALAPTLFSRVILDSQTSQLLPVVSIPAPELPLASQSAALLAGANIRRRTITLGEGESVVEAQARATALAQKSFEAAVSANGSLDTLRYGAILEPRGLVDVRGVGTSYDGSYYVRSVSHSIARGSYRQQFSLIREGIGTLKEVVRP